MLIDESTRPLGEYDCSELTRRVLALDEADWHRDVRRQQDYAVHGQTQSIVLSFCTGWPKISLARSAGWEILTEAATPIMERIIADHYAKGGTIIRAMLARLPPGKRIARHRDSHPSFDIAHRVHLPLATNTQVEFIVGKEPVPPRPHFAFELNNRIEHWVINRGAAHRIHLIFDYAPGVAS